MISRVTPLSNDSEFAKAKFHDVGMSTAHLTRLGSISALLTRQRWGIILVIVSSVSACLLTADDLYIILQEDEFYFPGQLPRGRVILGE